MLLKRKVRSYIFFYSCTQLIINSVSSVIDFFDGNNYLLYALNNLFSLIIIGFFFREKLRIKTVFFDILFISTFILGIFSIYFSVGFSSISFGILSIFVIILSFLYYLQILRSAQITFFYSNLSFWYITGLFIYYSSNVLIFFSYNNLISSSETVKYAYLLWFIHNIIFSMMFFLFIIIEIWDTYQTKS